MNKLFVVYMMLLSILLLNGCSKKEKIQKADETNPNDSTKTEYVEFKCDNMHCASCEETITTALKKLDGIKEVTANAKSKIVKVKFINNIINKKDIEKTINETGYDTQDSKSGNKHNCDME